MFLPSSTVEVFCLASWVTLRGLAGQEQLTQQGKFYQIVLKVLLKEDRKRFSFNF